jgi:hypothetical protein
MIRLKPVLLPALAAILALALTGCPHHHHDNQPPPPDRHDPDHHDPDHPDQPQPQNPH